MNPHASLIRRPPHYAGQRAPLPAPLPLAREGASLPHRAPRLFDQVGNAIRARHYSPRTEKAYRGWIRRYILFHGTRHPRELGAAEITTFLTDLATRGRVSASTQNQALSSLLFLYREVLGVEVEGLGGLVRAKRPARLPTVLTRAEVETLLAGLHGVPRLWPRCSMGRGCGCSRGFDCASGT